MKRWMLTTTAIVLPCLALLQAARGQSSGGVPPSIVSAPPTAVLPEVQVIGASPLLGAGVARDAVPAQAQVLTPQDISRTGVPSLTGALDANVPSVHLSDLSGNPFQPDILFRGFTASPVEGETQGLAVYVNGVRFNTPFGDTVNWDLIPSNAIAQVTVEGGNPVFGLNALGGSVNVKLKNGFTYHGGELTAYRGAYGRAAAMFQYGAEAQNTSAYVAANVIHDSGWRKTSNSEVRQVYTNLGWRGRDAEVHVSVTAADNSLGNPGATPVDLLSVDRSAASTAPNTVKNKYLSLNVSGSYELTDQTSLQAVAYVTNFSQRLINGVTVDFAPCNAEAQYLCKAGGDENITDLSGNKVTSATQGVGYSGLSEQGIDSTAYGASAQVSDEREVLSRHNHLIAGLSVDAAETGFNSRELVGGISTDRVFLQPSYVLNQADLSYAPVSLRTYNQYYGVFFTDRLDLTDRLALSLSGRFNEAQISLHDRVGESLTASHRYTRFNPGVGVTWRVLPPVSLFASYSEANRAPTPNESECSNPAVPCQLPNAFISDPALKQVVARTIEAGVRGRLRDVAGGRLTWDADAFRSQNSDDLIYVSALDSNAGGYYGNAGRTLRQGVEANLTWRGHGVRATLGYTYTDATYQTSLSLHSGNNPAADSNGLISVRPGDRLPGVPAHKVKLIVDYDLTDRWTVGGSLIGSSTQFLYADDANQTKRLGGYVVANVNSLYRVTDHVQLFALVTNVTNTKYSAFGTYAPVNLISGSFTNNRVYSPAAPVAGYGGARITF